MIIGSTPFILGIHDHPNDYYRFTEFGLAHLFRDFSCLVLKHRNGYLDAVYTLCLRLFNVGTYRQKRTARLVSPLFLAIRPLFWIANRFVTSQDATTGYFFVYQLRQTDEAA